MPTAPVARTRKQEKAGLSVTAARQANVASGTYTGKGGTTYTEAGPGGGKADPASSSAVDTNYDLKPGESVPAYNARIDTYDATKKKVVSTLSSAQGKGVVDTQITPVIANGKLAADAAAGNKQTNAATNAADAQNTQNTPADMYDDPLLAEEARLKQARDDNYKQNQQRFSQLQIANTKETKTLVDSLQAAWDQAKTDQEEANTAQEAVYQQSGIRSGQSRYAPTLQGNLVAAVRADGLRKIQALDAKYSSSIAEADAALAKGNLTVALEASASADKYLADAKAEIKDQIEKADKVKEKKIQALKDAAIGEIYSNGITDPAEILARLNASAEEEGLGADEFATLKEVGDALKTFEKNVITETDAAGNVHGIDKATGKVLWSANGVGKASGGSGSGNEISRTDAHAYGLPLSMIGMDEDQFLSDIQSEQPPGWFIEKVQKDSGASLIQKKREELWATFKQGVESSYQNDENTSNPFGE